MEEGVGTPGDDANETSALCTPQMRAEDGVNPFDRGFDDALEAGVFCTGVQNIMGNETHSESDHKGLIGSWGRHWPVNDTVKYAKETVGIATYIPQKYIRQEVKDKDNFLYTLSAPGSDRFHHYTMFTSCKETFGYPTAEAWFAYMREWKEELQHPVQIKIKN